MLNRPILRRIVSLLLHVLLGAAILLLLSAAQKIYSGFPLKPKGFIVPLFFGSLTGFVVWLLMYRLREKNVALLINKEKYRDLVENINDVIYTLSSDGIITYISPVILRFTGFRPAELVGTPFTDMVDPADRDKVRQAIMDTMKGKLRPFDYRISTRQGVTRWIQSYCRPDSDGTVVTGIKGVLIDISERMSTQVQLQEARNRAEMYFNSAGIIMLVLDRTGAIEIINNKGCEVLGYTQDELKGADWINTAIPPKDRQRVRHAMKEFLTGNRVPAEVTEHPLLTRKGDERIILWNTVTLKGHNGTVTGLLNSGQDITIRKKAEETLRRSEANFRTLFQNATDLVCIVTPDLTIIEVNKASMQYLGYSQDELTGMNLMRLTPSDHHHQMDEAFSRLQSEDTITFETIHTRRDGSLIQVETSARYFDLENQQAILCIIRDVSLRKKIDAEMQKREKLESIGLLAGGIAHDFNNILMAVIGNISLARLRMEKESYESALQLLDEAERAGIRARDLTIQLLTFSKGGAPVRKTANIASFVQETVRFALHGSSWKAEFTIPSDIAQARIDEGQISQVLNNLTINATQARPEGGIITVSMETIEVEQENKRTLAPGKYVHIIFSDNGPGIPQELLSKIFDPFFTTKSSGTGLGLATSWSILKKHEGHISVESEPGKGTTFHMYFPAIEKDYRTTGTDGQSLIRGSGRILVMDDEDYILQVVDGMLRHLGYSPELCDDGNSTIEKYEKSLQEKNNFVAVLLDLTIPGGKGGLEVLERLKEIDPEVKAIVSSGYSTDPVMAQHEDYGFAGVVTKPYRIEELSSVLNKVLS